MRVCGTRDCVACARARTDLDSGAARAAEGLGKPALVVVVPQLLVVVLATDVDHNLEGSELRGVAAADERDTGPALQLPQQEYAKRLVCLEGARVRADGFQHVFVTERRARACVSPLGGGNAWVSSIIHV